METFPPLIVVSSVKKVVKDKAQFNTSGEVIDVLNKKVQELLMKAMESAAADKRKTIMARDFT